MATFTKHTVRSGESMVDIARRYGIPVELLKRANKTEVPDEGQNLTIPIKHSAGPNDTAESVAKLYNVPVENVMPTTEQKFIVKPPITFPAYIVQADETLEAIAAKFDLEAQYIAEANGTDAPKTGQVLSIPIRHNLQLDDTAVKVAQLYQVMPSRVIDTGDEAIVLPPLSSFPKHVVQAGETAISIAQKYNISPKYLDLANSTPTPQPGQMISIPLRYALGPGESLRSVITKYDVPPENIVDADNIVLPPAKFIEHIVQENETLNDIAKKYAVDARLISEVNGTGPLKPGQILTLPVKQTAKLSDSASQVAQRYGVPVENVVKQEQYFLVKPGRVYFLQHVMQPGDNQASLAKGYGVTPNDLATINHTDRPFRGQILTMPAVRPALANDSVNSVAAEYRVPAHNVVQTGNRVFFILPKTGRLSLPKISTVPVLLGAAAILLLILMGVLLYRFFPASATQVSAQTEGSVTISVPADNSLVLLGSAVQVLSQQSGNIARSELWVKAGDQPEKLLRADVPKNSYAAQPWLPPAEGNYTIKVVVVNAQNTPLATASVQVHVVANSAIKLPTKQAGGSSSGVRSTGGESFQPPLGGTPAPPAPPDQGGQQSAQPQAAACSAFNASGAPVIRTLRVVGEEDGDVSRAANAAPKVVSMGLGKDLTVEWQVDGSNSVEFVVTNTQSGAATSYPFSAGSGRLVVPINDVGTYAVSMRANTTGECQSVQPTVEQQVLVVNVAGTVMEASANRVALMTVAMTPTPSPTFEPTATPTRFFEPPPPAPGVPPGPTQDQLPEMRPPVCDAADLLGVYTPNTSQRIEIKEPDQIPAKTVGGATVFRSWKLQNTGTCTWGPGYELAYYGGRSMGSGGVAFENTWPSEPGRRNIVVDGNRLIVPKGEPNQVAVVEVMLKAPVTPGIHQSYWRMRNPQGVYFGPIMGVTLDVVRQCEFNIYGAPVINKFEILGVGDVYQPLNPIEVTDQQNDPVTLDWNVINATNVDIVVESPTGEISNISSGDASDRAVFTPNKLGRYTLTMYADNGPCTVSAMVYINVVPREDDNNAFIVRAAAAADISDVDLYWKHSDKEVNQFSLLAQLYQKSADTQCLFGLQENSVPSWAQSMACSNTSGWKKVEGNTLQGLVYGISAAREGSDVPDHYIDATLAGLKPTEDTIIIKSSGVSTVVQRGAARNAPLYWPASNEGSIKVRNIMWGLCPTDPAHEYRVVFSINGQIDGKNASPATNTNSNLNEISVSCSIFSGSGGGNIISPRTGTGTPEPPMTVPTPAITLPKEIPDDSGQK